MPPLGRRTVTTLTLRTLVVVSMPPLGRRTVTDSDSDSLTFYESIHGRRVHAAARPEDSDTCFIQKLIVVIRSAGGRRDDHNQRLIRLSWGWLRKLTTCRGSFGSCSSLQSFHISVTKHFHYYIRLDVEWRNLCKVSLKSDSGSHCSVCFWCFVMFYPQWL